MKTRGTPIFRKPPQKDTYIHYIGNVIIPIDELICFRGVAQPPTSNDRSPIHNKNHLIIMINNNHNIIIIIMTFFAGFYVTLQRLLRARITCGSQGVAGSATSPSGVAQGATAVGKLGLRGDYAS